MTSASEGETHSNVSLRQTVITGGAAGDHTVTGIKQEDVLKSVLHLVGDGTQLTGAVNDLGPGPNGDDEFTITGDDTINNDAGTDTTNGVLIVTYIAAHDRGDDLGRS